MMGFSLLYFSRFLPANHSERDANANEVLQSVYIMDE